MHRSAAVAGAVERRVLMILANRLGAEQDSVVPRNTQA